MVISMEHYESKFLSKIEKIILTCGIWQSFLKYSCNEMDSLLKLPTYKGIIGIYSEIHLFDQYESENPIIEIAELEFKLSRSILLLELFVHIDKYKNKSFQYEIHFQQAENSADKYFEFQNTLRLIAHEQNLSKD